MPEEMMPMKMKQVHLVHRILFGLLMLVLVVWVGVKTWNALREHKYIGVPVLRNEITVTGEGRVIAVPDIAGIDLGTQIERVTVVEAQTENSRVMNAVIAKLKDFGIDGKDIQTTAYNIYPTYDYVNNRQELRGYQVSQNVHVKIRDLTKVGDIIAAAGALGANQAGNIVFSIDQPEDVRQEARVKALENAKVKAASLSRIVGVKLRRVVAFDETVAGGEPLPYYRSELGGGGAISSSPSIQPGSNEVVVTATVTYEIE
jgi:uncharacterized protein YggE